ncbi:MAG: hypothetical protein P1U40_12065 [Coxiellaceae bacterium]|nr:hypothetical protein [Coxiellaceae bacterium]
MNKVWIASSQASDGLGCLSLRATHWRGNLSSLSAIAGISKIGKEMLC